MVFQVWASRENCLVGSEMLSSAVLEKVDTRPRSVYSLEINYESILRSVAADQIQCWCAAAQYPS